MSKKYYVYCAYGVNNEILYIGKGSGNRYQHCNNGASANKDLNRYYFNNGEDSSSRTCRSSPQLFIRFRSKS